MKDRSCGSGSLYRTWSGPLIYGVSYTGAAGGCCSVDFRKAEPGHGFLQYPARGIGGAKLIFRFE